MKQEPKTPAQLKANRLTLAYRDMDDVKRYLAAWHELSEDQATYGDTRYFDHCEAMLIAAIVAYCRCFKNSASEGKASKRLGEADLECLASDPERLALHRRLIELRDKAIAHADWSQHHTSLLEVKGTSVYRKVSVPDYSFGVDPVEFLQLVDAVRTEVLAQSHAIDTRS